ncbi:organic cation transporter protein [Plakobranchus ocellatus]|uniref:Organic cation transporter protein n=1 Tax=Plakobranchus ocellatus TaxID=259542 RepID=A0AAV3Z006_9GAST|nr:organic cation transporter protein [Plakobranchus ocellatus]
MGQGLQNAPYSLMIELFQPELRPFAGVVPEVFFAVGVVLLAALAYFLRYWRHLQIAISLIPLLMVFYPWVVSESLRWLVMKGKVDKAEKQLHRICKTNKIPYPAEIWNLLKRNNGRQSAIVLRQYNVTHLFQSWPLMKVALISSFLWFVISLNYFALSFKITSFSGNVYLNFFLSGIFELISFVISLAVMNR